MPSENTRPQGNDPTRGGKRGGYRQEPASTARKQQRYLVPELDRYGLHPGASRTLASTLLAIARAGLDAALDLLRTRGWRVGEFVREGFSPDDLNGLLAQAAQAAGVDVDDAEQEIFLSSLGRDRRENAGFFDTLKRVGERSEGMPALRAWNEGPNLAWPVGLNIVAAPTSAGKTTVLIQQITEWLTNPDLTGAILLWSGETPEDDVWAKIVGILARQTMWDVIAAGRSEEIPEDIYRIHDAFDAFRDRLVVLPTHTTLPQLRRAAEGLAKRETLDAIVVDYIQELPSGQDRVQSREAEVGDLARGLRELANDLSVPVLAAAQFNRTVNKNGDYAPDLLQLRESGRIEQNAAVVIGLRNEDMSGAERPDLDTSTDDAPGLCYRSCDKMAAIIRKGAMLSVQKEHPDEEGWILEEAFVLKNRNRGGVGTVVPFALHPATGRCGPLQQRLEIIGGGGISISSDIFGSMKGDDDDKFERPAWA